MVSESIQDGLVAIVRERDALAERVRLLEEALRAEIERVCECDGEDKGEGAGIGAIDSERSSFVYGADAYNGAGDVIVDYFDCPCAPLRAALAAAASPETKP